MPLSAAPINSANVAGQQALNDFFNSLGLDGIDRLQASLNSQAVQPYEAAMNTSPPVAEVAPGQAPDVVRHKAPGLARHFGSLAARNTQPVLPGEVKRHRRPPSTINPIEVVGAFATRVAGLFSKRPAPAW